MAATNPVGADEQRHVSFTSDGIRITFPFEPYDIQREYVECVIKAANRKQNALLESPTGTGKTLSLLCSTLAWQQSTKEAQRMIYYTSRTHIQLNQAAKEMKKTAYAGTPAVVLGSRVHMCMNDEVKNQAQGQDRSINRACHNAIAKNACAYYTNYEQKIEASLDKNKVHDIEDLHSFGRASQCCPYYASRKIADTMAAVVFMPYNYLLDLSIQKTVKLKINNSIVIFDEGHNVESAFKESASAGFTETCLKTIQDSCHQLPSKLNDALNQELHGLNRFGYDPEKKRGGIVDEFAKKKPSKKSNEDKETKVNPIEELAPLLTNDRLQQVNNCAICLTSCKDMMRSSKGEYDDTKCSIETVYAKMGQAGVSYATSDKVVETLDAMASFWSIAGVMSPSLVAKYLGAVGNLSHFIQIMFPSGLLTKQKFDEHVTMLKKFYVSYLVPEFEKQSVLMRSNTMTNWQMHLWCLHPAVGLKRVIDESCITGPRSLIITSGTLAPMEHIENELEVKFPIIKEFGHLVSEEQFKITILGESPSRYSLQATHKEVNKPRYPMELGESLLRLFSILPFGTLVFFPSYPQMDKVYNYWKSSKNMWTKMTRVTTIFTETQSQSTFSDDVFNYKRLIDSNKRAVFLGVFRGKLSEGTNLEANHCRSVIIVGLPFPSVKDPKIVETRRFHSHRGDLEGNVWYTRQMRRALGQAIGRVIRSRTDFGMLFLCDPRFVKYKYSLSKWITKFYPDYSVSSYEQVANTIRDFFATHEIDISAMCLANASNTNQSAFEFEALKSSNYNGLVRNQFKPPVPKTTRLLQAPNQNNQNISSSIEPVEQYQSDKDKLLAQYRVDKETYEKAQEKKRLPAVSASAPSAGSKRAKTMTATAEMLWEISGQNLSISPKDKSGHEVIVINDEVVETDVAPRVQPEASKPQVKPDKKKSKNIFASSKGKATNGTKPVCESSSRENPVGGMCILCSKPGIPSNSLYLTNCRCLLPGHKNCLKALNNTQCAKCNEMLRLKNFKQILFNT